MVSAFLIGLGMCECYGICRLTMTAFDLMNILILTYGSRGDVQPFVALGKGLAATGHNVSLATSERFRTFVEAHGLSYAYMNDDLLSILDTPQGKSLIERSGSIVSMIAAGIALKKQLAPMQQTLVDDSWAAAMVSQPEIILFHPKAYAAPTIAHFLGIPAVLVLPFPMLVPTALQPAIGFAKIGSCGKYNRLTYTIVNRLLHASIAKSLRKLRTRHQLAPDHSRDLLHYPDGKPLSILHCFSPHVSPPPADWPPESHVTGYWYLDEDNNWQPPPALTAFLQTGPAPVYIGFGSMAGRQPKRLAQIVLAALARANLRGIIATGWGGLAVNDVPDTVLMIDQAPHEWLFSRVAAVVHHGGAGTTAAGLRAGRPSVIVPFFGDQPFWGRRVHALGAGPLPIVQKKLTVDKLANALIQATTNATIIDRAEAIGRQLQTEAGVEKAAAIIESLAALHNKNQVQGYE